MDDVARNNVADPNFPSRDLSGSSTWTGESPIKTALPSQKTVQSIATSTKLAANSIPIPDVRDHIDLLTDPVISARDATARKQEEEEYLYDSKEPADHCMSRLAIYESNIFRGVWQVIVALMLVYTGTAFLYFLCFYDLHAPIEAPLPPGVWSLHFAMDIGFYVDLVVYFFFTYNVDGVEIDSLWMIARNYLQTTFIINAVSCVPPEWAGDVLALLGVVNEDSSGANKGLRSLRLQRLSKLFRLLRMGRLAKILHLRKHPVWQMLKDFRAIRCLNFFGMMFLMVHVCACMWYLCAALADDHANTWLSRRTIDADGEISLFDSSPPLQWLHSMYFVLTVFTTVGFGDMSAFTTGEILVVIVIFLVGAVVHGYVIGEVITLVTRSDEEGEFVASNKLLIENFSAHTEIGQDMKDALIEWVEKSAGSWMSHTYDKQAMRELIKGRYMKRDMLTQLPKVLFKGQIMSNYFITQLPYRPDVIPPRLPTLLALAMYRSLFEDNEYVYQLRDLATALFLVTSGTFANVALPSEGGGKDVVGSCNLHPYLLFSKNNFFGEEQIMRLGTRTSTVRCEKQGGVLVLPKRELDVIFEEFPQFASLWLQLAVRRERRRLTKLTKFTSSHSFRAQAAKTIQDHFRAKRSGSPKTGLHVVIKDHVTHHHLNNLDESRGSRTMKSSGSRRVRVSREFEQADVNGEGSSIGQQILEQLSALRQDVQRLKVDVDILKGTRPNTSCEL